MTIDKNKGKTYFRFLSTASVLTAIIFFFAIGFAQANSVWQMAGSAKGYISTGAGYETDITVSDSGLVYAAFEDKKNSKKARVREFNGSSWTDLADFNNPLGLVSSSKGYKPALAAKSGEVYAAFSDQTNGKKIRVKKWDGSGWTDLSDVTHSFGLVSSTAGSEPELAFNKSQSILYLAFQDTASGNRTKVMQWDGSAWNTVSDENNSDGLVSSGAGAEVALVPSKVYDDIYIVFEDVTANLRLRVKKWDGSHWLDVTDGTHSNGLITNTPAYSPAIALDSEDRIYVVYTYKKEGNTYITQWDGSAWNPLGSGLVATGKTIESTVTIDEGNNVVVAMSQNKKLAKSKKSWRIRVREWDGQNWKDVADSGHRQGFLSKKGKGDPSLAAVNGKVYISFTDYSFRRRARVMYFNLSDIQ